MSISNAAAQARPDLIVGIDFGMTRTGVAYAVPSAGVQRVRYMQKWPGRTGASENKVPTTLLYRHGNIQPSCWGFECDPDARPDDSDFVEWFKLFLDETQFKKHQSQAPDVPPHSIDEVIKWYEDYLSKLYDHIEEELKCHLHNVSWESATVEFVFSLPTTWTSKDTIKRFKELIQAAGYRKFEKHKVEIGLTEAEAAAVHTANDSVLSIKVVPFSCSHAFNANHLLAK